MSDLAGKAICLWLGIIGISIGLIGFIILCIYWVCR